jgi:peptidyl-prolyl cis-trans isomerase D
MSDDPGSIDKGGDYGWFDENKGFVDPFKNAGLMGTKGNISAVETQFGYHIIEVLDVSKTRHNSYKVAQIFKLIEPSDETNQKIFAEANQFGGVNNTGELFDKAAETQKLAKRVADNIKEGDRQLPGLNQAKELVKWVYSANKGDVSIFSFPDKHIVAKIASIKNKGVLPLDEVKDEITAKVTREKKAEQFIAEFKNKAGSVKSINDIGAKMGLDVKNLESIPMTSRNVEGLGFDNILMGTAAGTKVGTTSRPTAGNNGVFVLAVSAVNPGPEIADYPNKKMQLEQSINGKSDYEIINALKDKADIEDHKSRID